MKLYREVKASERLPENQYSLLTNVGWVTYYLNEKRWGYWNNKFLDEFIKADVQWWLEPIDITGKEIEEILIDYIRFNANGPVENAWISRDSIDEASKAILSKLEG